MKDVHSLRVGRRNYFVYRGVVERVFVRDIIIEDRQVVSATISLFYPPDIMLPE